MDKARIEQQLLELPLFQYDWMETSELVFSERVRWICQTQCPMYNTTWACPPAVGTVEECKARCLSYPHALMMTSITEVSDIANLRRNACHARAARGADAPGARHDCRAVVGRDGAFDRGVRHLSEVRLSGRPLPPPGADVPLRGISGHSGHGPCRKARSGFYERQYRRLVLADSIQVSMRSACSNGAQTPAASGSARMRAIAPPIGSVSA